MHNTYDILIDGEKCNILSCHIDDKLPTRKRYNDVGPHFWVEAINKDGNYKSGCIDVERLTFLPKERDEPKNTIVLDQKKENIDAPLFWIEVPNKKNNYVSSIVSAKKISFLSRKCNKPQHTLISGYKTIYICSPLRGDIQDNIEKARKYSKIILNAGYIPLVPHVFFEKILNDDIPHERETALRLGLELVKRCDELWVFCENISEGMKAEIDLAITLDIPVKHLVGQINFIQKWR